MADHLKPTTTSTYANFVTELKGRIDDVAKGLDPATTSPTNVPTGSVRWVSASKKWEKWNGTAWVDLADEYAINIASLNPAKLESAVPINKGGTGAVTEAGARTALGIDLVASDYAGSVAPTPTFAYMTWADTGNMLLKRRNAANSAWVTLGPLLEQAVEQAAAPWLGKAVGEVFFIQEHLIGTAVPPTTDSRFRFIKLTAGDGYNSGALTGESVSGSAPYVHATAVVSNSGSPMSGQTVRLINTERRAIRAGLPGVVEDGQIESHNHPVSDPGHIHPLNDPGHIHATLAPSGAVGVAPGGNVYSITPTYVESLSNVTGISLAMAATGITTIAAGGNETRMRNIGVNAYMRIR